ncbi:Cyclic nucleotide-gated potassium channel [Rosistilla ulvae]|uniref:Cyclic nucleotide-gated potassium channel n=1 Tax=Rosistilla ulvae TaxID=1930277 RepID=A0A517M3S7_9BACT|nr:ion transporter [Rosistilla ulvae]QDS89520.1 Cyclic nucleotide-gated potassium channel [Rosistilla ulvae]
MPTLKDIVERSDTPAGRVFDLSIQCFIVLSLIAFSVETLPNLDPVWTRLLYLFKIASVVVFTTEYIVRLIVADRKLAFATSFFGVVDLLAILPFYLSFGFDLRSIRALRLLRLFWMLKLVRYSRAIQRFHRAFLIAREEIVLFLFVTVILLYLASVGIYHFEHDAQPEAFASVFHCLWWAVVTLTTVGYGDLYPITAGGRIFTFVILLIGLGIVSVPAGLVASALAQAREMENE